MKSEWSVQLYHRCDLHGEASLIMRNEPRERLVQALNLRTHQLGAVFNKDNPRTGRQERAYTAHGTYDDDDNRTETTVSLGTYLYGALILVGLIVHEQLEGLQRSNRRVVQLGSRNLLQQMRQFIREWMVLEHPN